MDIYLIRHTQTNTPKGLCYGQQNVGLADSFAQEVIAVKQKLPNLTPDCQVYSSHLDRCLQLAEQFSSSIMTDARLVEVNFGDWEGIPFNDIDPAVLQHWTENFVHTPPPNGESFSDLCVRVGNFWQELLSREHQQVVIITHAGVIRALLAHILKLPLAHAFHFRVDCGSVHKFQHSHHYTYIHFLNF